MADVPAAEKGGILEAIWGAVLFTFQWWGAHLDQIIHGAHAITAICGAVLGIHGVWRIMRSHQRKVNN